MTVDVTSIAWCLGRCVWYGLRVEQRGAAHAWDGGWAHDAAPWLRASQRGTLAHLRDLDAAPDSPEARMWVLDACSDELTRIRSLERWRALQAPESETSAAAIERLRLARGLLDTLRPTPAIVDATIQAAIAQAGLVASRRDPEAPVTVARAAEALGWPAERLAALVRSGQVRRVKVGARWAVPIAEVERLSMHSSVIVSS